jgi:hypothetical protein
MVDLDELPNLDVISFFVLKSKMGDIQNGVPRKFIDSIRSHYYNRFASVADCVILAHTLLFRVVESLQTFDRCVDIRLVAVFIEHSLLSARDAKPLFWN